MSHYDDIAEPPAVDRGERIRSWGIGLALTLAGGLSLAYLVTDYRAAAPWREARAVEYAREREARETAEQARLPVAVPAEPPPPVEIPIEWTVRPVWPALTSDDVPEGVDQPGAQFNCQVDTMGLLSSCTGTDLPKGTGLAERLLPALERARMKPLLVDGRPQRSKISFSIRFGARPEPEPETEPSPEPRPAPEPRPDPEPAPAG